jgi:hypothetical protein
MAIISLQVIDNQIEFFGFCISKGTCLFLVVTGEYKINTIVLQTAFLLKVEISYYTHTHTHTHTHTQRLLILRVNSITFIHSFIYLLY